MGLLALAALGACGEGDPSAADAGDRLRVVASFYPLAEAAQTGRR